MDKYRWTARRLYRTKWRVTKGAGRNQELLSIDQYHVPKMTFTCCVISLTRFTAEFAATSLLQNKSATAQARHSAALILSLDIHVSGFFKERKGEGDVRAKHPLDASCTPLTGDGARNLDVCPPGIELVTFWCTGQCSAR